MCASFEDSLLLRHCSHFGPLGMHDMMVCSTIMTGECGTMDGESELNGVASKKEKRAIMHIWAP